MGSKIYIASDCVQFFLSLPFSFLSPVTDIYWGRRYCCYIHFSCVRTVRHLPNLSGQLLENEVPAA